MRGDYSQKEDWSFLHATKMSWVVVWLTWVWMENQSQTFEENISGDFGKKMARETEFQVSVKSAVDGLKWKVEKRSSSLTAEATYFYVRFHRQALFASGWMEGSEVGEGGGFEDTMPVIAWNRKRD